MRTAAMLLILVLACRTPTEADRTPDLLTLGREAHVAVRELFETPRVAGVFINEIVVQHLPNSEIRADARAEILDNLEFWVGTPQPDGRSWWVVPVSAETTFGLEGPHDRGTYRVVAQAEATVDGFVLVPRPEWRFMPSSVVLERKPIAAPTVPPYPLQGTSWNLVEALGFSAPGGATIAFCDGRFQVNTGCWPIWGEYRVRGDSFTVRGLSRDESLPTCRPGKPMKMQLAAMTTILKEARTHAVEGSRLTIRSWDTLLVFER